MEKFRQTEYDKELRGTPDQHCAIFKLWRDVAKKHSVLPPLILNELIYRFQVNWKAKAYIKGEAESSRIRVSRTFLAKRYGCNLDTITEAIKALEELSLIEVVRRRIGKKSMPYSIQVKMITIITALNKLHFRLESLYLDEERCNWETLCEYVGIESTTNITKATSKNKANDKKESNDKKLDAKETEKKSETPPTDKPSETKPIKEYSMEMPPPMSRKESRIDMEWNAKV